MLPEQRVLLRENNLSLVATAFHDRIAAWGAQLQAVTLLNGRLHSSTLTTLTKQLGARLLSLDLSATQAFGDLAVKSLAAYCPEPRSIASCAARST